MSSISIGRKLWLEDKKHEVINRVRALLDANQPIKYRHLSRALNIPRTTLKRMIDSEFKYYELSTTSIRNAVNSSLNKNMSIPTLNEIRIITGTDKNDTELKYYLTMIYKEYMDDMNKDQGYYEIHEIAECLNISEYEVNKLLKSALFKMRQYINCNKKDEYFNYD